MKQPNSRQTLLKHQNFKSFAEHFLTADHYRSMDHWLGTAALSQRNSFTLSVEKKS